MKLKQWQKHISCDCRCKFNSTTCNSNQKWNNKTCWYECKNYGICKKDYSSNPSTFICGNGKYLKFIVDDSKIICDEIIYIMDIVSAYVSINSDDKKVRCKMVCYILPAVLLVITLLFIITITCYHYAESRSKIK